MPQQLGIGVVGLDHWYTVFGVLDEAKKRRGLQLVAVSDPSRSRLAEVERDYSPVITTTDYREVIDRPDVDLVCSLANTRDSAKIARAALDAGKHVACVKPMAMTLRQADSLIELAESRKRVLWSFDQLGRGRAAALKALISRGAIGQPISYHEVAWSGLPRPWRGQTGPSWWVDETLVPFGAWGDHAIYTIDILRFLFDAGVEAVHAEIGNKRYPKMKLEDYGAATLRFTNGLTAVLEHTWVGVEYYPHWTKIVGTKGVIHMDPAVADGAPTLVTPKGMKPIKFKRSRGGMLAPIISLIQDGAAKPSPARESRTNLAAAFAAYRSAKLGRFVTP
jgi:predicted dehydrogenase